MHTKTNMIKNIYFTNKIIPPNAFTSPSNTSTFQLKRLSVLSKTYLRLNPNALAFSIKRKYVFSTYLKSPNFSLFIQKIYISKAFFSIFAPN